MRSIDRLIAEHDVIERGLNLLEKAVMRLESKQPLPDGFTAWAPSFFAEFADRCHHAKEEDLLFPVLKERGIPEEGGPIGVMLHEHDVGRDCVRRMRESAHGGTIDGDKFAAAAKEFIPLLRQHIFKENNVLFQMATHVLSDADDKAMDEKFTEAEQQRSLTGMRERCAEEVTRWEASLE